MCPDSTVNRIDLSMYDLLKSPEIQQCRANIDSARTLPRHAFTSEEFLWLERDRIFSSRWTAVLFAEELPGPGDVKPFELVGIPLFAVRTGVDEIKVFHNICPYDGCLVVTTPSHALDLIETPYHGWQYDLGGKLIKIPYWNGTEDAPLTALNGRSGDLSSVRTVLWNGIVFINLSKKADSFDSVISPLDELLGDYRLEHTAIEVGEDTLPVFNRFTWNANWKTVLENTCLNILHEHFVHAAYRTSPETPRVDEKGNPKFFNIHEGQLLGFGYPYSELDDTYGNLPFPHLGRTEHRAPDTGYYLTFYPSLNITVWANAIEFEIPLPVTPGSTHITTANLFEKDSAVNPEYSAAREEYSRMFEGFIDEDRHVVEAVQKGRQSPVYTQQYYSEFWDENHYNLTQIILDDLEERR